MKIIINKKQYNNILLHEQKSRIEKIIIKENDEPLEKGIKEVMLCVAMMLGFKLTGLNKEKVDSYIKDKNIMSKIKTALENEDEIKKLISALEGKGMVDPMNKILNKASELVKKYNEIASNNNIEGRLGPKTLLLLKTLK